MSADTAVILWNTRYLQAALSDLGDRGAEVRPELVRHVAPLGWEHIGLTGDYVWDAAPLPSDGLRPLRRAVSMLAASVREFVIRSIEPDNLITSVS